MTRDRVMQNAETEGHSVIRIWKMFVNISTAWEIESRSATHVAQPLFASPRWFVESESLPLQQLMPSGLIFVILNRDDFLKIRLLESGQWCHAMLSRIPIMLWLSRNIVLMYNTHVSYTRIRVWLCFHIWRRVHWIGVANSFVVDCVRNQYRLRYQCMQIFVSVFGLHLHNQLWWNIKRHI